MNIPITNITVEALSSSLSEESQMSLLNPVCNISSCPGEHCEVVRSCGLPGTCVFAHTQRQTEVIDFSHSKTSHSLSLHL